MSESHTRLKSDKQQSGGNGHHGMGPMSLIGSYDTCGHLRGFKSPMLVYSLDAAWRATRSLVGCGGSPNRTKRSHGLRTTILIRPGSTPGIQFMRRRGFTLAEVLIGIVVLALGLIGIAAVFAKTTRQMAETTDSVLGRSARRSGDALYRTLDRGAAPLALGWNHEPLASVVSGIEVCAFSFVREGVQEYIVVVTASFKGPYEYLTVWSDEYTPVNRDVVVSWYGHIHTVEDGEIRGLQSFERAYPILVIPYAKSRLLDAHRLEYIQELDK